MKRRDLLAGSIAGGLGALTLKSEAHTTDPSSEPLRLSSALALMSRSFGEFKGTVDPAIKMCITMSPTEEFVEGAQAVYVPWYDSNNINRAVKDGGWQELGFYRFFDQDGNGWKIAGVINPKQGGAIGDGITDDSTALNDFFKAAQNDSLKMEMDGARYFCASPLKLEVPYDYAEFSPVLDGHNSTIIFSSELIEGTLFRVGGIIDPSDPKRKVSGQSLVIKNLHILGPGAADEHFNPTSSVNGSYEVLNTATSDLTDTIASRATGLLLESFINVSLDNVSVSRCWIGMKTHHVWPIVANNVRLEANFVNLYLTDDTTSATWTRCRFMSARYAMILRPSPRGQVYGQQFLGCHLENCTHGAILDPNDSDGSEESSSLGIHGIHFIGTYVEGIGYQSSEDNNTPHNGHLLRIGASIEDPATSDLNASEFGYDRSRNIVNVKYYPAVESLPTAPGPGNRLRIYFNSLANKVKDVQLTNTRFTRDSIENWQAVEALTILPGLVSDFSNKNHALIPGHHAFSFYAHPSDEIGSFRDISVANTGRLTRVETISPGRYRVYLERTEGNKLDYLTWVSLDRLGFVAAEQEEEYVDILVYDSNGQLGLTAARVNVKIELPY